MRGPAVEIDRIVREVLAELPVSSADIAACDRGTANGNGTSALPRGSAVQLPASAPTNGRTRGTVITLGDLDGRLDGRGELVLPENAIITPLARDYLKERGVALKHGTSERNHGAPAKEKTNTPTAGWGYAILASGGLAEGAIQAVTRQGTQLTPVAADSLATALHACTEGVAANKLCGAILFCDDAALVACAANKRSGVRAAVAECPQQVARAVRTLVANVLVVEPAGKTLHELRNILRAFCKAALQQPAQHVVELLGER